MMYEFHSKDGQVHFEERSMHDAPDFGEEIEVNGTIFCRVVNAPQAPVVSREIHSHSVEANHPLVAKYADSGAAIFSSEKAQGEFAKKDAVMRGEEHYVVGR